MRENYLPLTLLNLDIFFEIRLASVPHLLEFLLAEVCQGGQVGIEDFNVLL